MKAADSNDVLTRLAMFAEQAEQIIRIENSQDSLNLMYVQGFYSWNQTG